MIGCLLCLVVIAVGAVAANEGPRTALAFFWCGACVILLMNWAWRFMPGAVKLNNPANARLVPQARRRLVELSCLVCFAGLAGIASAPYTSTTQLGAALFWVVLITMGTGLAAAGHPAGTTIVVVGGLCAGFAGKLSGLTGALSHPIVILLSLPVYAVVIVVAVRAMFAQGGERHWSMEARRTRWTDTAAKRDPLVAQLDGFNTRGWYAAALRRDSARRDGRRLLLHALGPVHHPAEMAVGTGILALVLGCVGLLTAWRVDAEVVRGIGWMFAAVLLFVPLSFCLRLGQLADSNPAEQALARLAPTAPASSADFNRRLGRFLVQRAVGGWLLASAAGLVLLALGGADGEAVLRLAGICCLALPMVALPLRDHAGRNLSGVAGILLLLLSFTADLLLAFPIGRVTGLPVMAVAALLGIATTLFAVARGLRTMRASPCAFPAGRLA
ncbi:hypothetical protein [Massilia sp. IC2-476]|uniref:hypothetical protein n=1 Tax=Massilia sp. IC2-476 TaxID=2887199 RepID=UPI001D1263B7|nr:hypothetical protein [Massilia sp. IC2-476]MCC2971504.1 hypothetical protein [Massilia sp. IC2-476]